MLFRSVAIDGERVSALGIRYAGVTHHWYAQKSVTAELFDGAGISTETVRYADVTSFIILKALAFDHRAENKDAADLVHVMRYAGTPEEVGGQIVGRYRSGEHNQAIIDALDVLTARFCDGDNVEGYLRNGPIAAARFKIGLDPDDDDVRVLEQRNVSGLVSEIVDYVRKNLSDSVC